MAQVAFMVFQSRFRHVCQRDSTLAPPITLEPSSASTAEDAPSPGPDISGLQSEGWDEGEFPISAEPQICEYRLSKAPSRWLPQHERVI